MAQINSAANFHVTSEVFHAREDGNFLFHEGGLLIPHEALRRETTHALNAVRHFDIKQHPWKAHCFGKWFNTFFFPAVHEHHHLEEDIFFPFYQKLGADVPPKPAADHVTIIRDLDAIKTKLNRIIDLLKVDPGSEEASVLALELTAQFEHWAAIVTEHLAEEERAWPPIVEKFGPENYQKCETLIVNEGVKNGGQVFENFTAGILNAMGHTLRGFPLLPGEKGWCSEGMQKALLSQLPAPVRVLLLPTWNKRYHRLKGMIMSCAGDVDNFHVQDQQVYQCSCIIA